MKLLLVNPKRVTKRPYDPDSDWINKYNKYLDSNDTAPELARTLPLSLLIVGALTPPEYEIETVDEYYENINFDQKYDLIAITAMTCQAVRAYEVSDEFRKRGIKVIMGGPHATLLPEEVMKHADSVVIGEAELLWGKVLSDFENNTLQSVYKTGEVVDIKKCSLPRYELMKGKDFYNAVWFQTTRGCVHDCEFCAASKIYGNKYRKKTVDQIINEVTNVKKMFKNKKLICFSDDNLLSDKKRSKELLERLIPLKINWIAFCDISIGADIELLKLCKKSGCIIFLIGLESVTEEGLYGIDANNWKYSQLKNYPAYIKNIQDNGIGISAFFIFGLDSDDTKVFEKTQKFIDETKIFNTDYAVLTPYPGTRVRERIESEKRLLDTSWDSYTKADINIKPKKMTKDKLAEGLVYLLDRRPGFLYKFFKYNSSVRKLGKYTSLSTLIKFALRRKTKNN